MSESYNVAVVGATGAVGEAMLEILAERKFPAARCTHLPANGPWARRCATARAR